VKPENLHRGAARLADVGKRYLCWADGLAYHASAATAAKLRVTSSAILPTCATSVAAHLSPIDLCARLSINADQFVVSTAPRDERISGPGCAQENGASQQNDDGGEISNLAVFHFVTPTVSETIPLARTNRLPRPPQASMAIPPPNRQKRTWLNSRSAADMLRPGSRTPGSTRRKG
jgi:hypothetical protein